MTILALIIGTTLAAVSYLARRGATPRWRKWAEEKDSILDDRFMLVFLPALSGAILALALAMGLSWVLKYEGPAIVYPGMGASGIFFLIAIVYLFPAKIPAFLIPPWLAELRKRQNFKK